MKLTCIGDVHGKFSAYMEIVKQCEMSIQVGDFGIGFGIEPPIPPLGHYFIRGNHDNPEEANNHISCLGDYGMFGNKVFFSAGAYSIDKRLRTPGIDWWDGEEMPHTAMDDAMALYLLNKPEIVISHSLPHSIQQRIFDFDPPYPNRTGDYLDKLLSINTPKTWVCGHYHIPWDVEMFGCRFIVLPELGTVEIDI